MDVNFDRLAEEIHVMGSNLVDKVKELIHEGNVQRIVIKNEQGHTLVEIPVTLAAIGVVAAPVCRGRRSNCRPRHQVHAGGGTSRPACSETA